MTRSTTTDPMRASSGFNFDLNLCTGCCACELACSTENQLGWGRSWRQVISFNEQKRPSLPTYHLSLACNHCLDPPCVRACPARAIERNDRTGAILIEPGHCIGCRYCSWACPYGAPIFDLEAGVMGKCTGCDHRLVEGGEPACVEQCPTRALTFGTLRGVETVAGFPKTRARPAIRFEPLVESRQQGPECSWQFPAEIVASFGAARMPVADQISLRGEWPLLVFSLSCALLAGWILASLGNRQPPAPGLFVAVAAIAAGASLGHLGRKLRAWRAVLNLRGSWLSREIFAFSLFGASSLAYGIWPWRPIVGVLAAIFGLLTLFSIDRVYDVVRPKGGLPVHSADTILTGLLVAALGEEIVPLVLLLLAAKLVLYCARMQWRSGNAGSRSPAWSWVLPGMRLSLGFGVPALSWIHGTELWSFGTLAGIGVGELLDRAQFYQELEIRSPRRQIAIDLTRLGSSPAAQR